MAIPNRFRAAFFCGSERHLSGNARASVSIKVISSGRLGRHILSSVEHDVTRKGVNDMNHRQNVLEEILA